VNGSGESGYLQEIEEAPRGSRGAFDQLEKLTVLWPRRDLVTSQAYPFPTVHVAWFSIYVGKALSLQKSCCPKAGGESKRELDQPQG